MRNPTRLLTFISLIALVTAAAVAAQPLGLDDAKVRVKNVDCDNGQSISRPLEHLQTPLEIIFTGTCTERLLIDRSDITIRGGDAGATVIGSIFFTGSLRSTLQDFTLVVDETENAVELQGGSSVYMENFHVSEFTFRGILVDKGAEAVLSEVSVTTVQEGAVIGLLARGGTIFLDSGLIELTGAVGGMSGTLGGRYFITGADLFLHDNGTGAFFQVNAAVIFQSGSLRSVNNNFFGMVMTSGANIHHGNVELQASDNGIFGIIMQSGATIVPFPGTGLTLDISNNPSGGLVVQDSSIFLFPNGGEQTISGNGSFALFVTNLSNLRLTDTTTITGPVDTNALLFDSSYVAIGENTDIQVPLLCDDTVNIDERDCDIVIEDSRLGGDVNEKLDAVLSTLNQAVM